MGRIEKEEFIIGSISLLANKLSQIGDVIFPDITFKQWFLLIVIEKMGKAEKNINDIAECMGTTRQNIKKMVSLLEPKGYVSISKSQQDARALKVQLTEKTYSYFKDNSVHAAQETNKLFEMFTSEELDDFVFKLQKLSQSVELYQKRNGKDE